ncbi:signal peptidase I [Bacillus kwashiorkori]|uniref:signal peptidase I n=1 Tax=Bacillus kwashiorkori TaxID=1522318 RepID=UPI000784D6D0|nr:signal peptidase I [Bacillus kwashiorkori]
MERLKKEGLEWGKAIVIGFVIFIVIRMFLFTNYVVQGESMEPTLVQGNKLVVNKISYTFGDIERFDVIVFHANDEEDYVKRVIGLPGDKIEYRKDKLYINDRYYEEYFLEDKKTMRNVTGSFSLKDIANVEKIPDGYLFVLGDNRMRSEDSRHFGLVPIDEVVGKVNLRYWPLNQWEFTFKN